MYSKELADAMKAYLDSTEYPYSFFDDEGLFVLTVHQPGKIEYIDYGIFVDEHSYYLCAELENLLIDETNITAVAEYLHKINSNYSILFYLDFESKTIRCKQVVNCDGIKPTDEFIKSFLFLIPDMIKMFGDGLIDVIKKESSPKAIFDRYEKYGNYVEKETYSDKILNVIKEFLDLQGLSYEVCPSKSGNNIYIMFKMNINSKLEQTIFTINICKNTYSVSAYLDFDIKEEALDTLSEYLHRINSYCLFSNFEFAIDKKMIYSTSWVNCVGITPSYEMIKESIYDVKELIEDWEDFLADIVDGKQPDKEKFEQIINELLEAGG